MGEVWCSRAAGYDRVELLVTRVKQFKDPEKLLDGV